MFGSALALVALSAALVRAQPADTPPIAVLSYEGDVECVERGELAASVESQLGRTAFAESGEIAVRVAVHRDGAEWTAAVELARADGTALGSRRLRQRGGECRGIDGALALVLALLLDSGYDEIVVEPPAPVVEPPAAPAERPPLDDGPSPIELMLAIGVSLGDLPSIAPLAELRLDIDLIDLVALVFRTHGSPPFGYDVEGAAARAGYWTAGAGARLDLIEADPIGISSTGVLDVGAVFGEGVELDPSRSFVGAEVVGELGLELRLRAGSTASIVAGIAIGFPFFSSGFSILENTREIEVFTPSPVWGRARVGLEIGLGS
jgi:hypothetical protein